MAEEQEPLEILSARHVVEYPYTRSVGAVIGRFLGGLKDKKIEGSLTPSGRVLVPPSEYDPESGASISDFVEVGEAGVVTTWCWVAEPLAKHPFDRPFAWALIRLDGADTALLHAVDAGDSSRMATGMRVKVRWRQQRSGAIGDIECFEAENLGSQDGEIV